MVFSKHCFAIISFRCEPFAPAHGHLDVCAAVAPVQCGKRETMAKHPVNPAVRSFLGLHMVKYQDIV